MKKRIVFVSVWIFLSYIFLSLAYGENYTALIKPFEKGVLKEQNKSKKQLFEKLMRDFDPINKDRALEGKILFADVISNLEKECIVVVGLFVLSNTNVFIFQKQKNEYKLADHLRIGILNNIFTINLLGGTSLELVLDSKGHGTSWQYLERKIYKWNGKKMSLIWEGVIKDIFYGGLGPKQENYDIQAKIGYLDVDNDGIKEIVREETEKHATFNEETKKWDNLTSKKTTRQVYKWHPEKFKYELLPQ